MKTLTRKFILQEFSPALLRLAQLQANGGCQLEGKVSYTISKAMGKVSSEMKSYMAHKEKLLRQYVNLDEKDQLKIVKKEGEKDEYDYVTPLHKEEYMSIINEYLDEKVYFEIHTVAATLIEQCWNIPADVLALLDELGMITELNLATPGMTKLQ